MDFESIYREARAEIHALARMGLDVQTFIPAVLDPQVYPKRGSKGDVVINKKTGEPEPAFCGRNPSFWTCDGKPILAKPNQPCALEEALKRIDTAEQLNQPIGIGVIPQQPIVVIDIDKKCYQSTEEMHADIKRLLELYPQLLSTRVESTPGGGCHIYVRVKNMESWQQANGALHCNFSTVQGGPHRGEILTGGNRFCASAPSMRFDGHYQVVKPEFAETLIEIDCLSDISIYPTVQKDNKPRNARTSGLNSKEATRLQSHEVEGTVEQLSQLLTEKSQRVLKGDLSFKADDRSGTLGVCRKTVCACRAFPS